MAHAGRSGLGPVPVYGGLALGVTAVSTAAVLIRLADAPALAIASYRLGIAAVLLLPLSLAIDRTRLLALSAREKLLMGASALCLALHFAFWIASLSHTSVASSVVIVTANPILVAIAAHVLLRESLTRSTAAGIGLGLAGGVVIALGDWDLGDRRLYGDGLALLGAAGVAGYYIIGRDLRRSMPVLAYVAPVYGLAAVVLLASSGATGAALGGFSGETYLYLVLLALVPQLLGHSSLNWALGHLPATLVAVAVMAEPVGATLLAWAILDETPPVTAVAGGALILVGVYLALRR